MADRIWRGDAVSRPQIVTVTPGEVIAGRVYSLLSNGKKIDVTAPNTSPASLCSAFVSALQLSPVPEFREVNPVTASGVLTLTSKVSGTPFSVSGLVGGFESTAAIVVTIGNQPTGGTWSIDFGTIGSASPAYDASSATVQGLMDGLFGAGNTVVSKLFLEGGDRQYTIQFAGSYANTPVPACTVSGASLTGGNATVEITYPQTASVGTSEVQTLDLYGVSGGTMVIGYRGVTATVAYNVSTASLQATMRAFATINGANINVTGTAGTQYVFTFVGDLAHTDVEPVSFDGRLLTGSISASISVTTPGVAGVNCLQYVEQLSGVDEAFTITRSGTVSGGTFRLSYGVGGSLVYTSALAWNAKLYQICDALEAAAVTSMGSLYAGPYFAPQNAWTSNYTMSDGSGTLAIAAIGKAGGRSPFTDGTLSTIGIDSASLTGGGSYACPGTGGTTGFGSGVPHSDGTIAFRLGTSGPFTPEMTLAVNSLGVVTSPTAAEVQTAMEALSNVGAGNVLVSTMQPGSTSYSSTNGARGLFKFEFVNALAGTQLGLVECIQVTGGTNGLSWTGKTYILKNGVAGTSEVQTLHVAGSPSHGGFTLAFKGQETAAIAYNATAATVDSRLEDLSTLAAGDVTCTGGALPGSDVVITFGGQQIYQDVPSLVVNDSGLKGILTITTPGVTGRNEKVSLSLTDQEVWAGTVTLTVNSSALNAINWNATAATLQTELDAALGSGKARASAGPWPETPLVIEYIGTNAETDMPAVSATDTLKNGTAAVASYDPMIVATIQSASGPNHWNDPSNWSNSASDTDYAVPGPADNVWFSDGKIDVLYGLTQRTVFTVDTTNDWVIPATPHDLLDDQQVECWTTDALPTGLSAGPTYYYVRDLDIATGKFRLSTAIGGAAVNISGAGTGTHQIGVRLNKLVQRANWTGKIGLPWRNSQGYKEYRPLYLGIGFQSGGAKLITLGVGVGNASSRIHVDSGTDQVTLEVINSAGSTEGNASILWKGTNASSVVKLLGGDLGIAVLVGEEAEFNSLEQRAGQIDMGVVDFVSWDKTGGTIGVVNQMSLSGVAQIRA